MTGYLTGKCQMTVASLSQNTAASSEQIWSKFVSLGFEDDDMDTSVEIGA